MAVRRPIEGLFSVTVTPFGADGALDLAAFATILGWHLAQGSAGIAIAADNGEASLLTITERQAMAETAVRVVAGRVPVIMGAMGTHAFTAAETIKMAEVAAAAGVDALLISPTPYNGPPPAPNWSAAFARSTAPCRCLLSLTTTPAISASASRATHCST